MKKLKITGSTYQEFLDQYNEAQKKDDKQDERIKALKQKLERLEKKTYENRPYWGDYVLEPIAKEVAKQMPDFSKWEIFGPFGLTNETSIHFYKNGIQEKDKYECGNCVSITFRPHYIYEGNTLKHTDFELNVVNRDIDTGEFEKGTIGAVNGMNNPEFPLPKEDTINWIVEYLKQRREKDIFECVRLEGRV